MKYKQHWENTIKDFCVFLKLEKSLSENSIEAYNNDLKKIVDYLDINKINIKPEQIQLENLQNFLEWLNQFNISNRTQARIISAIKTFYKFLMIEELIETNPSKLLEAPRIGRKLPDVLSVEEIDKMISIIDLSSSEGHRNKAIIETLYSCGLRVSELVNLKISDLFFALKFIKIEGKGDKERIVPISERAINYIELYKNTIRNQMFIHSGHEDFVFLNRKGKQLSRIQIFNIVKKLAQEVGIKKNVSPHTFRHSFASHLVDGGADLRAVQEMLGHESITTTEIYTHLDNEYLRDTILSFHPRTRKNNWE